MWCPKHAWKNLLIRLCQIISRENDISANIKIPILSQHFREGIVFLKKTTLLAALIILTSGCALWNKQAAAPSSPEIIYARGYKDYQKGSYERAIESFQKLKEEYPLSDLATRAEIGIADARFSTEEYGQAESAYNTFASLHPTNEFLPYVLYQIGMCQYKQLLGIDRDQTATMSALREFEKLISRFPGSQFSILAEKNVRHCKELLAEHEFYVGNLYFKMKQYKAAMRRFKNIAKNYSHLGLDEKLQFIIAETRKGLANTEDKANIQ